MKQSVLGTSAEKYKEKLNRYKMCAGILAVLLVVLNAVFLWMRNEQNHNLMLILSIVVSVLLGWILTALFGLVIKPMSQLYELYKRPTDKITFTVEHIDKENFRVENFDCVRVYSDNRIFFLIANGNIGLCEGETSTVLVASNIITGVIE